MSQLDLPPSLSRPDGAARHEASSSAPVEAPIEGPVAELPPTRLEALADWFTRWAERYLPDAFVFALVATFLVVAAALAFTDSSPRAVIDIWGGGFWDLLPFTMQMGLIIINGYVLAVSPFVHRLIARLASLPKQPRAAVALVALFAMLSSWFNWGFSLIFSAILAKEVARRMPRADYRALGAAAFMGLGSIWAQGLSGSAALLMASAAALPDGVRTIVEQGGVVPGGLIPLQHTIFLWQSLVSVVVEIIVVTALFYWLTPVGARARGAAALGITLGDHTPSAPLHAQAARSPGERLEHSRVLNFAFVLLAGAYLVSTFAKAHAGAGLISAFGFNTINLMFLTAGVAAHGTPHRLMRAVKDATPAIWALVLQYPFYAGIAALIAKTHLNAAVASWFVSISTPLTFPGLVAIYSAVLGMFVPSGGSKWVIEAPYVLQAAHDLKVHLGWMVAVYDLGEAVANLVQPFWMLPVLGLLGLRAKDVMGFTFLIFLVMAPLVLVLVTVLGATLSYPL